MRHRVKGKKLGRDSTARKVLFRNLTRALVKSDQIETTVAKAKYVKPKIEKLVTLARKGNLASRRILIARLGGDIETAKKLVEDVGKRFKDRPGGYTRIQRTKIRQGDKAQMVYLSFVKKAEEVVKKGAKDNKNRNQKLKKSVGNKKDTKKVSAKKGLTNSKKPKETSKKAK